MGDADRALIQPWPTPTRDTILLAAGLGRCGTSLLLQMLDAGGYPVWGSWPDYEGDLQMGLPSNAADWARHARGRAMKALDPHRWQPPAGEDYRIIWLDRDPVAQAESQASFVGRHGGRRAPSNRNTRRGMAKLLKRDAIAARLHLLSIDTAGIIGIRFEDLIRKPALAAREINAKLGGGLDEAAMARQVVPRTVGCSRGLIEATLIATGRAA